MPPWPDLDELPSVERVGWPYTETTPAPEEPTELPRISIVIPSFRQGEFLEETLRSILLQAYSNVELIVVDGGSDDATVDVLWRYDPWIAYWTSEPDRGQSDAINKGFARATGEVVTFFGSDDIYEPGALLEVGRQFRASPGCGAIVGAFRFLDEPEGRLSEPNPPRLPSPGPQDLTLLDPASWRLHQVSTLYARHALDAVGRRVEENLHYTMDRDLLFRVAKRFPVVTTDRSLAAFRRHPHSKSVASILPMSREMGALHLHHGSPDDAADVRRRRRKLARHHWARGHWKLALSGVGRPRALLALLAALVHRPDFLFRRGYLRSWADALGVTGALRSLRRLLRAEAGNDTRST